MDVTTMNRKDFSVEIKIVDFQSGKEKTFDVPVFSDNLVWSQLLVERRITQSVVLTDLNITLTL
jgi:hypothetical protein